MARLPKFSQLGLISGLTIVLLNPDIPCICNIVDPDQLASEEAESKWSGYALFAIKLVNV